MTGHGGVGEWLKMVAKGIMSRGQLWDLERIGFGTCADRRVSEVKRSGL